MEREETKRFDGYLFSKLALIGSKSEGPQYMLQQWDYKEIRVIKKVHLWQNDPNLHKFLGKRVTIIGFFSHEGIEYESITELQPPEPAEKKLELELKTGVDVLLVNKMPSFAPIKQSMILTLRVKWPYRSIWTGTCLDSQIYDFIVEYNGKTIWKWSDGRVFNDVITSVVIPGGDFEEFPVTWEFSPDQIQEEGTYKAKGLFIASDQRTSTDFEVKFVH